MSTLESPYICTYCTSKKWQKGLNLVLEGAQKLFAALHQWLWRRKGEESRIDRKGGELSLCSKLIWRSPFLAWLHALVLLAASHSEQRLAGSEEVRSCVLQKQLKIHLAANGKLGSEGHICGARWAACGKKEKGARHEDVGGVGRK